MKKLKILFLTTRNIESPTEGLSHYSMAKALQHYVGDVIPLIYPKPIKKWSPEYFLGKLKKPADKNFNEKVQSAAISINKSLKNIEFDLLFAPMGSLLIPYLEINQPVIYLSDATFQLMNGYYFPKQPENSDIYLQRDNIEKLALKKANLIVLSNTWAFNSVIDHYKIDTKKVCIIHSGPNFECIPDNKSLSFYKMDGIINLLMVGREWDRKGGDIGLEIVNTLNKHRVKSKLTICGMLPPVKYDKSIVNIYTFLDKTKNRDLIKLKELYQESHFLLFPSIAECNGIAGIEANAFGLPVIAHNTGGLSDYVKPGYNGELVDSLIPEDYINKILLYHNNAEKYKMLRFNSRQEYELRLNWAVWANKLSEKIKEIFKN